MASPTIQTGSTYAFTLNAKKDGVAWNITGGTITLDFCSPRGVELTRTATVTDGPNGVAVYTSTTTELVPVKGLEPWARVWTVSAGGIVQKSGQIGFNLQIPARPTA